ncbi:hypothetical protein GCM10010329_02060 [Streptomyces spiroverticillatus]|uniref:Peptidoglycan binding domain-containing protein n=1 Tax=Streptomyces finlayi TaxID=67296 RepID=A0A918WS70_9ACTN|nr:hypothetical protein [Streptomyces finlayi]GGZ85982.1 hypothetical protein GCM10010329_02060 [Streptomyces spiroverticillatus]GHC77512.1 hypothetical protein GCM10010334_02050 [Streptomyces finlayi]
MSRETDSSSSGAQGRGGTAYPSGTTPYGQSPYPSLHQDGPGAGAGDEPAEAPEPDEPRTETTLTTRIRINIPGSRPIPPVVMRKPMADSEGDGASADGSADAGSTGETVWPPSEPLSAAPSAADASATGSGQPPLPTRVQGATVRDKGAEGQGAGSASGEEKPTSDWFAPRKAPVTPQPSPDRPAPAPAQGGGLPYFTDGTGLPESNAASATPTGPTTGPANGSSPLAPKAPSGGRGFGPETTGQHYMPGAETTGQHQMPGMDTTGQHRLPGMETTGQHQMPGSGSASGPWPEARPGQAPGASSPYGTNPLTGMNGAGGLGDDTALLTPQTDPRDDRPAGPGPMTPPGYVSGDTLTSGVPVVQPDGPRPQFPSGPNLTPRLPDPPGASGPGRGGPVRSEPAPPPPAPKPAAPAKKGRSKVVLLAVGVVVIAGGVYGAGLLLNHSDVPKGTTVLGVDIGGGTKDEAVVKLDAALGKRAALPLQLVVDGKKTELAPGNAGLSLDSQETVRGASGTDYNPVSVVGSLFGGERVAEPVVPVDEEKLTVALTSLAGTSGTASDGSIDFSSGKAVAKPGKPGKALDAKASMAKVRDAYLAQVRSGKQVPVELPVVAKQPTITQAELDRAMKEFAEPAMSGLVRINAGTTGKGIDFGPGKSLPKILSMKAINGKLIEVYDLKAMKELCGSTFDGVMVNSATGKRPLAMEDVRNAMRKALVGKTKTERTQTIDLNPT